MKIIKIKYAAIAVAILLTGASVPSLVHALDAQTPAAVPSSVSQTIVLQNVIPADVLKSQHWDKSADLPVGVTKIQSLPTQNALSVTATPAGLAKVRQIVKQFDVQPSQVLIKSGFARVSDAQLKASGINLAHASLDQASLKPTFVFYTSSGSAVQLLQTQTKQLTVVQASDITTTDNVTATMRISDTATLGKQFLQQLTVTPHINGDGTITLVMHPIFAEGDIKHEVTATRTIKNGGTEIIAMPLIAPETAGQNMVFYVTPTTIK